MTAPRAVLSLGVVVLGCLPALSSAAPQSGGGASAGSGSTRALRVEQRTSGLPAVQPGSGPRTEVQVLLVAEDGKRLVLEQYDPPSPTSPEPRLLVRRILRLDKDPPVTWDISPDGSTYVAYEGDLNKIQKDRNVREIELGRRATRLKNPKERADFYRENGLRPDGRRVAELAWGEESEILGRRVRRLTVDENGRRIIDCYVCEDCGGGRSFFSLYRRLGAFSEEVLATLADIKGLPLNGTISVVTKISVQRFDFEVEKLENVEVPASTFELPPDAKEIEESEDVAACPICGAQVEESRAIKIVRTPRIFYFDKDKCRREFIDREKKARAEGSSR